MTVRRYNNGFTLMELLIALFVFSLLSAFAFSAINMVSNAKRTLNVEQQALTDIEKAFSLLEGDIRRSRSLALKERSLVSAETDGEVKVAALEIQAKDVTKNVQFYVVDNIFYRNVIDSSADGTRTRLIENVEVFETNLDGNNSARRQSGQRRGIEITLQHQLLGAINRIIYTDVASLQGYDYSQLSGHLRPLSSNNDFNSTPSATTLSDDDMDIINSL